MAPITYGMGIERAAGEADVRGTVVAEALHQPLRAAQHADGQPAAERLAVRHHVGPHAEILLGAAVGDPEPDEHLVEDQHDRPRGAHLPQLPQPRGVRVPIDMRPPFAADPAWRHPPPPLLGWSDCSGFTSTQAMSLRVRSTRSVASSMSFSVYVSAHDARRADAGLHIVPPPVVRAAEAHEVRPPGVVPRQPHCLHHRFGARHVERHFVHAGNVLQFRDVVGDDRVIRAEHRTQVADALDAGVDALLVEVVPEHVGPVGAGEVVGEVAVEVSDEDADDSCASAPTFRCLRT